ncbi:hypothetical protein Tco_0608898 [Tanacetum coccineum]
MHNMWKKIGELHALLIEYEKGLPKNDATPQVLMIQGGKIQKPNKKPQAAKGKGKGKRLTISPNVEVFFDLPNVDVLDGGYFNLTLSSPMLKI